MTSYKWAPSLNGVKISKWRKTCVIPEYNFHFCERFKFNQSSTFFAFFNDKQTDYRHTQSHFKIVEIDGSLLKGIWQSHVETINFKTLHC